MTELSKRQIASLEANERIRAKSEGRAPRRWWEEPKQDEPKKEDQCR